jgi:uncharacterized protein DUF6221
MTDLLAWLRVQLDDDERIAKAADEAVTASGGSWDAPTVPVWGPFGRHIARHRSARVLADVAAKRAILDWHARPDCNHCSTQRLIDDDALAYCTLVRLLAQPFADHSGYDETWRP